MKVFNIFNRKKIAYIMVITIENRDKELIQIVQKQHVRCFIESHAGLLR